MNNSGEILSRMKSIRQTVQISNAQKLIAASRIGKARRMLKDAEPYHDHVRNVIAGLLSMHPEVVSEFVVQNPDRKSNAKGLLVISSDTGLAGGYNSNLLKFAEAEYKKHNVACLIVQGSIGGNYFRRLGHPPDEGQRFIAENPSMRHAGQLADYILKLFSEHVVDSFDVIYTYYHSVVKLTPVRDKLFPLAPKVFGEPQNLVPDISFEPSPDSVLSMLIPKYIKGYIYGCLVHAWASELSARVQAMDSAISNGRDMLDKLSLAFNRARQAAITQEITEIVAGATAMNSDE